MRRTIAVTGFLAPFIISFSALAGENMWLNDHWKIFAEFLYIQREEVGYKNIVDDVNKQDLDPCDCFNLHVLNVKKVLSQFNLEPGVRASIAYQPNAQRSLEGNFLWINPWEGRRVVKANQSLYFPFRNLDYTSDYVNASKAVATYTSRLWGLEFNYWRHWTPRYVNYFSVSGVAGLRYFNFREGFKLQFSNPPDKSDYDVHTDNNMFGVQLGLNLQLNPTNRISWDVTAKVGPMVNHADQRTLLRDQDNTVTLRNFKHHRWNGLTFADVLAVLNFQAKDHFNVHVGYELMYFSNVALAPDQINKKTRPTAGRDVKTGGHPIFHGVFAGIIIGF